MKLTYGIVVLQGEPILLRQRAEEGIQVLPPNEC